MLNREEYLRFIKVLCSKSVKIRSRVINVPVGNKSHVDILMKFTPSTEVVDRLLQGDISDVTAWHVDGHDYSLDELLDYLERF